MELCYGLFIGGATALLRTPVVSLFVTGPSAQAVVELGARYLGAMAVFYLLPAFTNGFQGYFRGMGRLGVTLLGTLIQTSLRVVFTMLLAPRLGILGIAFACAGGLRHAAGGGAAVPFADAGPGRRGVKNGTCPPAAKRRQRRARPPGTGR